MAAEAIPFPSADRVGKLASDAQHPAGHDTEPRKTDENSVTTDTATKQSSTSENGPVLTPVHRNGYQIPAQRQNKQTAPQDIEDEKTSTEPPSSGPTANHTIAEQTSNNVDRSSHSTGLIPDSANSLSKHKGSVPNNNHDQPRHRPREGGDQYRNEVDHTARAPSKQVYDAPHRRAHAENNSTPSSSNSSNSSEVQEGSHNRYNNRSGQQQQQQQQQQRPENRRGMGRGHSGGGNMAMGNGGAGPSGGKSMRQGMQGSQGRGSQHEGRLGNRHQQSVHRGERGGDVGPVIPPGPPGAPAPSTDLERFLVQVTPMLQLDQTLPQEQAMLDLLLEDVWRFYCEPSMYGREVYTLGGQRGPSLSYFVPYLSAMQLFVPASPGDPGTRKLYICDVDGWPKHMHMVYEYFEHDAPHTRAPLHTLIESLSSSSSNNGRGGSAAGGGAGEGFQGNVLLQTRLASLHPASWFAVAWYPVYRIPDAPLCARFLTFHSFAPLWMAITRSQGNPHAAADRREQQLAQPVVALQVIGLKWYNMQTERWFDNLSDTVERHSSATDSHTDAGSSSPGGASDAGSERSTGAASHYSSAGPGGGRGGKRQPYNNSGMDYMWQAHLSELQASADRLSRGIGLRVLGQMGAEDANLSHPDYDFFNSRA